MSVEKSAPPVALLPVASAGNARSVLESGRFIYIGKCARCHAPEPIVKYSPADWVDRILPEMAPESKLSPTEYEAVKAYVLAVCRAPRV